MKKLILAAAFVMGLATLSFAGNPNETKEVKAETPTDVKSETTTQSTQYAVTNVTTVAGVAYYFVAPVTGNEDCGTGTKACLISTNATPDGQSRIRQDQATIDDVRVSYP